MGLRASSQSGGTSHTNQVARRTGSKSRTLICRSRRLWLDHAGSVVTVNVRYKPMGFGYHVVLDLLFG